MKAKKWEIKLTSPPGCCWYGYYGLIDGYLGIHKMWGTTFDSRSQCIRRCRQVAARLGIELPESPE